MPRTARRPRATTPAPAQLVPTRIPAGAIVVGDTFARTAADLTDRAQRVTDVRPTGVSVWITLDGGRRERPRASTLVWALRPAPTDAAATAVAVADAVAAPAAPKSAAARSGGTTARRRRAAAPAPPSDPPAVTADDAAAVAHDPTRPYPPRADLAAVAPADLHARVAFLQGLTQGMTGAQSRELDRLRTQLGTSSSRRASAATPRPRHPDAWRAVADFANTLADPAARVSPGHVGMLLGAIPAGTTDPLFGISHRTARAYAAGTRDALALNHDVRTVAARATQKSRSFYGRKLVAMLLGVAADPDLLATASGAPIDPPAAPAAAPPKAPAARRNATGNGAAPAAPAADLAPDGQPWPTNTMQRTAVARRLALGLPRGAGAADVKAAERAAAAAAVQPGAGSAPSRTRTGQRAKAQRGSAAAQRARQAAATPKSGRGRRGTK